MYFVSGTAQVELRSGRVSAPAWNPSTTSTTAEAGANFIVACVHMLVLQGLSPSFPLSAQLPASLSLKPHSIPLRGAQIEQ